jgi:hypothetical protein
MSVSSLPSARLCLVLLICLPLVGVPAACGGDDDVAAAASPGLPEGTSTWGGRFEGGTFGYLAELTLVNTGGDLTATVVFDDDPAASAGLGRAVYTLTGTHEPRSGIVVLAPQDWTEAPAGSVELLGFEATYDPVSGTLTGIIVDYASGGNNSQVDGTGVFTLLASDGAPTTRGDAARGLDAGAHTFFGNLQCTGPSRILRGTLDYDGAGAIAGTVTIGGPAIEQPIGTFAFVGVHNPDTGAITLSPRLWLEASGTEPLTFFVDGAFDVGTGRFDGALRTNTNACPSGVWGVEMDL